MHATPFSPNKQNFIIMKRPEASALQTHDLVRNAKQTAVLPSVATHVGPTLRRLRIERGLSLAFLAKASGVSVGMLSQIERDKANPSLRVLTQIRQALDVPVSALFETPAGGATVDPLFVRRGEDHPMLELGYCTKELLTAGAQTNLQMMILHIPPRGSSGAQPIAYPAEKAGFMLEGELVLKVGEQETVIKVGDSFIFDSTIPHAFHNFSATNQAKLLWVIGKFPSDPHL
ncbi:MAG: helix-turn-helix domain-containing protein [Burkholderiales bacterium]|nr:helix-turn-helix domain-containing protein [Burkholderiales bacterium]